MEADEYRRMAAVEDEMWFYRALHAHLERVLVAALEGGESAARAPRLQGQRTEILDAGCGTGGLIRRLAPRHPAWRWTGIDVEPLACELARGRGVGEIVEASVLALPFATERFDAVVSADVLYHLDDDEAALRELARVLQPGGVVVVNVPAHRWLWSYHDVTVHGRRRYERGELRAKLTAAGFEMVAATHWNTLPLPLVWARRKLLPPPRSGSDVRLYPRAIEAGFDAAMALERAWLRAGGTWPVGSSLLAVARKPGGAVG